jgi:hypothetical protein
MMTRQVLIVVGVAFLSVLGFALILAIGYMTLHLVLGDAPYTLESRIHSMLGTLSALFALVAVVAAGWTASVLSSREKRETRARDLSPHPRVRG